ncbi:SusD/RagB family nutrient-binding outer membrane lipoprotein [Flagellimonas flava]|uniref:Starch-binding associating with outer membrane n=1 Tax=Flagellimonas flava TaxID=570519 RepID=A0A1M5MX64_9FLAO|nr:SusD/RagB family nutrient-binding outer membrane lipoprotein [Allomuricauda flava]SHG81871.1 Starch-binding associating with outer membrane [Allomuricauda flava]
MKVYKMVLIAVLLLVSCQSAVDDINENPNQIGDVDGSAIFTGIQLADVSAQMGFLNWAGGVVAGYFVGDGRLSTIQDYGYNNTDSDTPWSNIYIGVVNQARKIRSGIDVTNRDFFFGASKVMEAHALGTATNVFGDIPFTEAGNEDIPNPTYDGQVAVYGELQALLDSAISDLQASGVSGGIAEDLLYGGSSADWIKAAYTLKARFYLDVGDYASAISAAQSGIANASETMQYIPATPGVGGGNNFLNELLNSSTFGGDISAEGTFLIELIGTGAESRNNAKTDEVDRFAYYYDGTAINLAGIAAPDEPMKQISLEENTLIWAEALARGGAGSFDAALAKLNEHRANLRAGEFFTITTGIYEDYVSADFENGGIENLDGSLSREDALLREVIEERYVTFFNQILGFNDLRRTKKDPAALQVPVPFNSGAQHPERFLYPFSEENTNGANVPQIADIFVKTPINQ